MATPQLLDEAFDRIDDFLAVQGPRPGMEAVLALQAAVGVDAGSRAVVGRRAPALVGAGPPCAEGCVLLGILIGLFAAEGRAPAPEGAG